MDGIFFEISVILIAGTTAAAIAKFFKQPMIPAYILAGVIIGPPVLHIIHPGDLLQVLSSFGIAFLLFLVGIELDVRSFIKMGRVAVLAGILQMSVSVGIGYLLIRLVGLDYFSAIVLAFAMGFSSTILGVKMMQERHELDSLYGQIVIGMMLTQDFIAVLLLMFFPILSDAPNLQALFQDAGGETATLVGMTLLKGMLMVGFAYLGSRFFLQPVFRFFARATELLFLGAICWCLFYAMLAQVLGFSIEVGAILAGVSLSTIPYSYEISSRIRSLRDFFLPIFFAVLGGELVLNNLVGFGPITVVLSVLVLFVSPVVIMGFLLAMGYRARTSFMAGVAISQISEFSFVLTTLAFTNDLIPREILSLVALLGLITMTISSYSMEYADPIYKLFRPLLKRLERKNSQSRIDHIQKKLQNHTVIFGFHTLGQRISEIASDSKDSVLVVDYNPIAIQQLEGTGYHYMYGTMNDTEILENCYLDKADIIISTLRDKRATLTLLEYIKAHKVKAQVIVLAQYVDDALKYYDLGATYVMYPALTEIEVLERFMKDQRHLSPSKHKKQIEKLQKMEIALMESRS